MTIRDSSKLGFIVGHYKAGSTWLSNILSLHPDIVGVRETHAFRYAEENLSTATSLLFDGSAWGKPKKSWIEWKLAESLRSVRASLGLVHGQASLKMRERPTVRLDIPLFRQLALRRELSGANSPEEFCETFFFTLAQVLAPPRYLFEKTPTNIFQVPNIRRFFPKSKLIAVYRDGRDVVTSDFFHRENRRIEEKTFEQRVLSWKLAMDTQIKSAEKFDVLCVPYEGLRKAPEHHLSVIFEYLSLADNKKVIEDMIARSSFEFVTGRVAGEESRSAFYRKGSTGDWKNHFSPEQSKLFLDLAGGTLKTLGYE